MDSLAVVDVGTNLSRSSPVLTGSYFSSTYMDTPQGVALSPDGVYAVVDVSTPSSPKLKGSFFLSSVYMSGATGVAISSDGKYACVACHTT